jgi:hypothetical protein
MLFVVSGSAQNAQGVEVEINMKNPWKAAALAVLGMIFCAAAVPAQEKAIVGLIPKARNPIHLDGRLDEWEGAFVTPVHIGHPDFANRGAEFLFLWDEQNLYIGLRCLDQRPNDFGPEKSLWDGDAVEFYLDTRRGQALGAVAYGPGTLHMFWTPFTDTEIKPRMKVRDLPVFKDFRLRGAEVAGAKTSWGYTAEFKLPWANFPGFEARAGEVLGIDCELCSSDDRSRVDRTFVFASPLSVSTPSAFGRVQLVDKITEEAVKPFGRVLLPMSLTKSGNYPWLYSTICVSPSIAWWVARLEGNIVNREGKVRKRAQASRKTGEGTDFSLWTASWEVFDLPAGVYTVELTALDKEGKVITSRSEKFLHGEVAAQPEAQRKK